MTMLHKALRSPTFSMWVVVGLLNATAIKADYVERLIKPDTASIKYGMTDSGLWKCYGVVLHGHHVKKDGSLGINTHKWSSRRLDDKVQLPWDKLSQPERWARMLADAYRPEGHPIIDPTRFELADIALLHPEVRP